MSAKEVQGAMVLPHLEIVVCAIRAVDEFLNDVAVVVQENDDGGELVVQEDRDFLCGQLERTVTDKQVETTAAISECSTERSAHCEANGSPQELSNVRSPLGPSRLRQANSAVPVSPQMMAFSSKY